jgi:acyl-CoA synthetase (AMP-forming)/AMP-acid ligase II
MTRAIETLLEPLRHWAGGEPDRPLLTFVDERERQTLTAAAIYAAAVASAERLSRAGVRRGDVVMLALDDTPQLIAAFLGALRAAAVPCIVPSAASGRVPTQAYAERLAPVLRNAVPKCLVVPAAQVRQVQALVGSLVDVMAAEPFIAMPAAAPQDTMPWLGRPDDLAFLQYSSGSGGTPKGVGHRHRAVLRYLEAKRVAQPVRPHEVIVSWLPLYHDLGLVSGLLTPLVLGVRAVLMSPTQWVRRPGLLLRVIHEVRGTLCFMPNFALSHCVRAVREHDLAGLDLGSLDALVLGAEPVRTDTLQAFVQRFSPYGFRAAALRAGYGMAELVEAATVTPPGAPPTVDWVDSLVMQDARLAQPLAAEAPGATAVVSCGAPLPGVRVMIQDDVGRPLPERSLGEIWVRSGYMLDGYYRDPARSQQALRDGWLRTGDLGYVAAGELYVTGRLSDLMIVDGRNLHAEDIEMVVERVAGIHPGRVVAFGLPDPAAGTERIVVVAELTPEGALAPAAIERRVRAEVMQALAVTLGAVRLVDRGWIRKTSSGKNARRENRERYLRELAARPAPAA